MGYAERAEEVIYIFFSLNMLPPSFIAHASIYEWKADDDSTSLSAN